MKKVPKARLAEPNCAECLDNAACSAYKKGKYSVLCQLSGGANVKEGAESYRVSEKEK